MCRRRTTLSGTPTAPDPRTHHAVGDDGGELDHEAAVVADDGPVRPALPAVTQASRLCRPLQRRAVSLTRRRSDSLCRPLQRRAGYREAEPVGP